MLRRNMSGGTGADKHRRGGAVHNRTTARSCTRPAPPRHCPAAQEEGNRVAEQALIVFSDYVCPYCRLAEAALKRLREDGVAVEPAAFELWPQPQPLPSPDEAWMRRSWQQSVEPLMREMDVRMSYPGHVPRTRKAHEAVAFARSRGAGPALHEAMFDAYWRDSRDIGRIDVLVDIGGEAGLDRGELRVALDIDQYADRVAQDLAYAAAAGLRGVPAYFRVQDVQDGLRGIRSAQDVRVGLLRHDELRAWMTDNDV
jgi:predicted DsbA family dithiol-disulfide isomerase